MKHFSTVLLKILFLLSCLVGRLTYADDFASISSQISQTGGIHTCTKGYGLLDGKISDVQPLIKGALPFALKYQASIRPDALSGVYSSYNQNEQGTTDWSNNYSSYMMMLPSAGLYFFKTLGGDQNYLFSTDSTGHTVRVYTSGGSTSTGPGFTSTDTRDIKLSSSGSTVSVVKDGVTYVYGSMTTLSTGFTLARITNVYYPGGKTLTLKYDGDNTLLSVQDNRNNSLTFERNYSSGLMSSQTTLQKSLITAVVYTSGNDTQRATISYTNPSSSVYQLQQSVSPAYGTYTYQYANVFRPALYSNSQKSNQTGVPYSFDSFTLPTLASVTDAANNVQQKWDVSSNYVWNDTNKTFSTAQVTLTSYSPLDSVNNVGKTSTLYDDLVGKITMSTTVTTASGSSTVSQAIVTFGSMALPADPTSYSHTDLTVMDAADSVMTITGNYQCVTNGNGTPIQATKTNVFTSQVKQITDGNSNKSSFYYDSLSRLTSFVEAVGSTIQRTTTYAYGNLSNGAANPYSVPTVVTAPEVNITNTLNARGQISQQTKSYPQSGSSSQTWIYDYFEDSTQPNYGLLGHSVNPRGVSANDQMWYSYDNYGNLAATSKPVANVSYYTSYNNYNSAGQPASVGNPDGTTDTMTYDAGYRTTKTVHGNASVSQTTSNTYNALGQLTSSTDADSHTTTYAYDVLGRPIAATYPNGNKKTKTYFLNNVVSSVLQTLPNGTIHESHWTDIDTSGRLIGVRDGGISSQMWTGMNYDANNNVIKTFTAGGIINTWTYDALNRVTSHTDGNGKVDTKAYDDANNNTSESASGGAGSARYFKNHDILASEHNDDYGNKDHYHDLDNNEYEQHHIDRVCNAGTIDQIGRPQQKNCYSSTYTDPTIQVNDGYTYDQSALGNLDKITATNSGRGVDTNYSYDIFHRVTSKTQVNHTPATWGYTPSSQTVGYSYTNAGKLSSITYPSGNKVNYWYDSNGMLNNIQLNNQYVVSGIGFDGANRLAGYQLGNGSGGVWQQWLNDQGLVQKVKVINGSGGQIFNEDYVYDIDGRMTQKTKNQTDVFGYAYDNDSQLTSETYTNVPAGNTTWSLSYTYDDNGNRLSLRETGTPGLSYTQADYRYTANHLNLWTKNGGGAQPLGFTPQGELSTTYMSTGVYDDAGRRRGESGTNVGMYFDYNHNNERTFRGGSYIDRQYAYDEQSHLIGEYTPTGALIVEYIYMGDRPVAAVYPGNRIVWILTDNQSKPRSGIDAATGQQVWYWNPDAFGVTQPTGGASLANGVEINLRFPGQYYDVQSGLYYNHNRYYNPELGRYMEPDPTGLDAGLNPYEYAGNNPVNAVDPSGLMAQLSDYQLGNVSGVSGGISFGGSVNYAGGGYRGNSITIGGRSVGSLNIMGAANSFISATNNTGLLATGGYLTGPMSASQFPQNSSSIPFGGAPSMQRSLNNPPSSTVNPNATQDYLAGPDPVPNSSSTAQSTYDGSEGASNATPALSTAVSNVNKGANLAPKVLGYIIPEIGAAQKYGKLGTDGQTCASGGGCKPVTKDAIGLFPGGKVILFINDKGF